MLEILSHPFLSQIANTLDANSDKKSPRSTVIAKSNSSGGSSGSNNSNEIELTLFIVLRTYDRDHFYKSYTRDIPAIVEVNRVV
jgi:hypothetical protein